MHNLFAISLIVLISVPIVIARLTWVRPNRKKILVAVLIGMAGLIVTIGQIPRHGCHAGGTVAPSFFTALSLGIIYACSRLRISKFMILMALLVFGSFITRWSSDVVHSDNCTGNKNHAAYLKRIHEHKSDIVREALTTYPESAKLRRTIFPGGWIEEVWLNTMEEPLLKKKGPFIIPQYNVSDYWHSWFSGIYTLEETDFGVWCHGGKYPEIIDRLELKQRTEP